MKINFAFVASVSFWLSLSYAIATVSATETEERVEQAKAILASEERMIVIGDLHGDLFNAMVNLQGAGVVHHRPSYYPEVLKVFSHDKKKSVETIKKDLKINKNMIYNKRAYLMDGATPDEYHWCAGHSTVIFTGDAMDVGPDGLDIVRVIMRLQKEAAEAGGRVEFLLGNHEVRNLNGEFDGVHPFSLEASGGPVGRKFLLSTQTELGRWLRKSKAVLLHKGIMFVHGGFTTKTFDTIQSIIGHEQFNRETMVDELNNAVKRCNWYDGTKDYALPLPTKTTSGETNIALAIPGLPKPNSRTRALANVVSVADYDTNGDINPLLIHPLDQCEKIQRVLDGPLKGLVTAQVVGHTPHKIATGLVYCNGSLYAEDFGNSRWKTGPEAVVAAMQMIRNSSSSHRSSQHHHGGESYILSPFNLLKGESYASRLRKEVTKLSVPNSKALAVSLVDNNGTTAASHFYENKERLGEGVVVSMLITTPPKDGGVMDDNTESNPQQDPNVINTLNQYRVAVGVLGVLAAIMAVMLYKNAGPLFRSPPGPGGATRLYTGTSSEASTFFSVPGSATSGYGGTSTRQTSESGI